MSNQQSKWNGEAGGFYSTIISGKWSSPVSASQDVGWKHDFKVCVSTTLSSTDTISEIHDIN